MSMNSSGVYLIPNFKRARQAVAIKIQAVVSNGPSLALKTRCGVDEGLWHCLLLSWVSPRCSLGICLELPVLQVGIFF